MIVKNEEKVINNCLSSVYNLVDEIIIVDTGSTDHTKEIVQKYTQKIYDFQWHDNFSTARNYSFSKGTMDYIFWLDADDCLLPVDQDRFKALKSKMSDSTDAYSMIYHYAFDEYHNVSLSFRKNRMVKRSQDYKWHGFVHEYLDVAGSIEDTDICVTHNRITHDSNRNLNIYQQMERNGITLSPRDIFYYGKELFDHEQYQEAIDYFLRFLKKEGTWIEDTLRACLLLSKAYYALDNLAASKRYSLLTFEYEAPRAEACCQLGLCFIKEEFLKDAIFWYEYALNLPKPTSDWAFTIPCYSTWLPHLQLCVCYYCLGDIKKAYSHHLIAKKYCPNHKSVLFNETFFTSFPKESLEQ
jgi:glycosyltransferase involved in cell wall biosynthesis